MCGGLEGGCGFPQGVRPSEQGDPSPGTSGGGDLPGCFLQMNLCAFVQLESVQPQLVTFPPSKSRESSPQRSFVQVLMGVPIHWLTPEFLLLLDVHTNP